MYDFVMSLDGGQSVRLVKNNALLMPLKSVFVLLHTTHEEVWAAARQEKRFLPVPKTMAKFLEMPTTVGALLIVGLFHGEPKLQH